jgi:hypothetical protein
MGGLIKSFETAELGWFPIPVSAQARANITAGTLVEDLRPFGTNVASLPGSSRAAASSLDSDRPSI